MDKDKTISDVLEYLYKNDQKELAEVVLASTKGLINITGKPNCREVPKRPEPNPPRTIPKF